MRRRNDWASALYQLIQGARARPFRWGEHDCLLFAARAVHVMTGVDPAGEVRGTYWSASGAIRRLRALGFSDLESAWDSRFPERICPRMASRGDVVSINGPVGLGTWGALGVVYADKIWAPGIGGLVAIPASAAVMAWRI